MAEEATSRDDVALLELAVVGTIFLDGVVSQLHGDVLFLADAGVVLGVLLAACADVGFFPKIHRSIRGVE